ncbi:MAG: hypothetical protein JWO78_2057 [Micavibrio sp.]|nr:hypothetical protein [Micavibrio sp.]
MLATNQWHKLDRDRTVAMIDSVKTSGDHIFFSLGTSEAKCAKLPFYKNYLVYRLTNYSSLPSFSFDYIGDGRTYHHLDGSTTPIYRANDSGNLSLSAHNVLDYISFFFAHVSGPDGDVYVIDNPHDNPALDALGPDQMASIQAMHQPADITMDGSGNFVIATSLWYLDTLVRATVQVDAGGRVNITGTQMLMNSSLDHSGEGVNA